MREHAQTGEVVQEVIESTIWVAKAPGLRTILDICNTVRGDLQGATYIEVWSSAGELVNELKLQFTPETVASLDLCLLLSPDLTSSQDPFTHATVYIRSPLSYVHAFRLVSDGHTELLRLPSTVSRTAPYFAFVAEEHLGTTYYGIMNDSDEELEVQCRLYFERFYREVVKVVPAQGSRVLRIDKDFQEVLAVEEESPSYLRLSQKSEIEGLFVQLLDARKNAEGRFSYVSCS